MHRGPASRSTGAPPGQSPVDCVADGRLLNATGPGDEQFVDVPGSFSLVPRRTGSCQAERQLLAAGEARTTWHVAKGRVAAAIEDLPPTTARRERRDLDPSSPGVVQVGAAPLLGASWGPRRDVLEGAGVRVSWLVESVAAAHDDVGTWCRKGQSQDSALTPVALTDTSAAVEVLVAGQHRRDVGEGVVHELGSRVSVWNGRPQQSSCRWTAVPRGPTDRDQRAAQVAADGRR